ncbi:MAG TPA: T9SS type A sorting domain-containing protein [Flavobacteriaceae bacterium]|nr:T9SS type A sorting domain-containing protein [Flavobacteriaceae bacterium]
MKYFFTLFISLFFYPLVAQTNDVKYTRAWGTYFDAQITDGGRFDINDIDTDANGNFWLVGSIVGVTAADFITSDAHQSDPGDGTEVGFITKFSSDGNLLYGSFFGGETSGNVKTISILGNDIYISGGTNSPTGIATPGAYQETLTVNMDVNGNSIASASFIAKFNDLGVLQWATYYQGNRRDGIYNIEAGHDNDFFIWGGTTSSNLATPGAFRENIPDPIPDGQGGFVVPIYPFLARFSDSGQPLWATYYAPDLSVNYNFAGNSLQGMAVDSNGNVYVAGFSMDTEGYYGSPGAHQSFGAGNGDVFISKFSISGQRLWSTYFGGSEGEAIGRISIPRNSLIISGLTESASNIATPGTWQDIFDTYPTNCYVAQFDFMGQQIWGTYLPGITNSVLSLGMNMEQNIFVYGVNNPINEIIYEGSYQDEEIGDFDNRILKLNPSGSILEWGTFYGGTEREFVYMFATSLSVTNNDELYIIGETGSTENIASENAFQNSLTGDYGNFIAKFVPCPTPIMPVAESPQDFQPGESLADLEVETQDWTGSEPILTWYADEEGTQILSPETAIEPGTTYYVSQSIQGCDESGLLAISIQNLGIFENEFSAISLFPNPNNGNFTLKNLPEFPLQIKIVDILGRNIQVFSKRSFPQEFQVSLNNLETGIYFLEISGKNAKQVFKFMVE